MMVLMIGLMGCKEDAINGYVDDEVDEVVEPVKCADYREVVEINQATYQVYNNTCNTITNIVFDSRGELSKVTKVVDTYYGNDVLVTISYNNDGFSYTDKTVGRHKDEGTQYYDYNYVNGDNFISVTYIPSYFVRYIYEGELKFSSVLHDALYDVVIDKVKDVISAPEH